MDALVVARQRGGQNQPHAACSRSFTNAGIGGVEICPIYGAKGYEDRFIDFLTPKWMEMLAHTTTEAKRLDLGVDMTTGTGWPFGGPHVTTNDASAQVNLEHYVVAGGGTLQSALPKGRLQCLMAFSDQGKQIDLTAKVKNGALDWTAPAGQWKLYAMALDGPVQVVKRAGPGGVGSVLDPFSVPALNRYLSYFDKAFAGFTAPMPRSMFHDSYEYYFADGTPDFFSEFQKRRGYDLHAQLPALFDEGAPEKIAQVKSDYRETLADLHLAYIQDWTRWAHSHGMMTRNQAHGGPDNLLDTYAAADIPEMEIYSAYSENQMPMMKIAPSAAHLTGRPLASSESFTWMTAHFNATLSQVKQAADFLFISGVNHIFSTAFRIRPPRRRGRAGSFTRRSTSARRAASGTTCRSSTPTPRASSPFCKAARPRTTCCSTCRSTTNGRRPRPTCS